MLKMLKEFFMGIDFQHSTGLSVEDTKSNMEKLFEQEATKEIFNGKVTDNKINFAFTEGRQKAFGVKGLGVIFVKNDKTFLKTKIFCGSGPRVMASIWRKSVV